MPDRKKSKINNGKVLNFGELLLRICPDAHGHWLQESSLPVFVGGSELNVASALALWDVPVKYLTSIPENGLTSQILTYLEKLGIDTSPVHYADGRLGLYFLTKGEDLKHETLVYDRANSVFAKLTPGTIDWEKAFEGVSWFHFSAICPAISQSVADVCLEALEIASKKNITISVDLNYRSKLWQYGKLPKDIMPQLVSYCNIVMGNIWAAEMMLDIPLVPDIHESGQKSIYQKAASTTSEEILKRYKSCHTVANTFRFDETGAVRYYSTLYQRDNFITSNEYTAIKIIDKVGSGDCFMAGLIYGFYHQWNLKETLEFATTAAFEQLFTDGDATDKTVAEIKKTMLT